MSFREQLATFEQQMADYMARAGTRIRAAREQKNMSQEDLAHELGVSVTTLGEWERGNVTPRGQNWKKLERVLKIKSDELRGEPPVSQLDRIEKMLEEVLAFIRPPAEVEPPAEVVPGPRLRRPASTPQAKPAPRKSRAGS